MSQFAIQQYFREVDKIVDYGGSKKETAIRNAFYNLLNQFAEAKGLVLVAELSIKTAKGKTVTPDGTLKDAMRQDWGFWESKDEKDDLDDEIRLKFSKGYPSDNILFEDSQTLVLFQNGAETMRGAVRDADFLEKALRRFVDFERPEVSEFRQAIELFKSDVPEVARQLRELLSEQAAQNPAFLKARDAFHELCKEAINPEISLADIEEMVVQHVLTADIFNTIFDESDFHRENNIARELEAVIRTFLTKTLKENVLRRVRHYYEAINAAAAGIADHHEKQRFLKVVYETFYKSYNPKAADRLGVVYTPNEIVRFMIESTDYLLQAHFNRKLEDKNVEILDPATGTGTYICELIDYLDRSKLAHKYRHELHANELAILPYYIANLNIEFTFRQKMQQYEEFKNLCFVDTLDNLGFDFAKNPGKQSDLFGSVSAENLERIQRQNLKKIAVIIGNPPYNANQANENDNNKNREYFFDRKAKKGGVDGRIKETFIHHSTAQKTKLYDMYSRFYRWAFDRLNDLNGGIVCFVTNRSFIDSRTFDGFRKCIQIEFDEAFVIDTHSDVRANPKISGTGHNVFGIQTGVAVLFLIKKSAAERTSKSAALANRCRIQYLELDDFWRKDQKLAWFAQHKFRDLAFEKIEPDAKNNWVNLAEDNDWDSLIPLIETEKSERLFQFSSLGVSTNRDEWVYDFDKVSLKEKAAFFIEKYNQLIDEKKPIDTIIKWSNSLISKFEKGKKIKFDESKIMSAMFRPFIKMNFYAEKMMSDRLTQNHFDFFGKELLSENRGISIKNASSSLPFYCLSADRVFDLHFTGDSLFMPLDYFDAAGQRHSNLTPFGLNLFRRHYQNETISGEQIFEYVYAALHDPAYRKKYEINLKREFPRIPLHADFEKWAGWGRRLLAMHVGFETAAPFDLKETTDASIKNPKPKLRADRENGSIQLDEATVLTGIPPEAWAYKLGNRSALDWILDQYKEKKPSDPTIAERFNAYRFADHKKAVIDLLRRVATVSLETMRVVGEMPSA